MFSGWVPKAQTIAGLISDWNESAESSAKEVEAYNANVLNQYKEGSIHPKALEAAFEPMPQKLKQPSRSWCQWWRMAWGWSMLTRSADSQQWLPYEHADLQATRDHVADLLATGTHGGLVLNWDQIWRNSYDVSKFKVAYKTRANVGKRTRRTRPNPQFDKKSHAIKGARKSMTDTYSC